ncbi:hypothetical protein L1987_76976 [Smallanthus sonchifolius]|uniref:Uncharacterized protein n=1 Tax=Smallanthus sonchifolius TaxID=185202 RepID=A0ACB8Z8W2_9ASTR|nr:hypothetical protein L1987_76976 [Smallanthus sonchifolius]
MNVVNNLCFGLTSGGGLVAYSDVRSFGRVYADAAQPTIKKKKVVVLGTGWAGTSFLKNLKDASLDVQVVSPCNYFAFTPLLPSVTVGTVEARSVVEPIRNIVKKKNMDVHFKEAECFKIDTVNHKVHCKSSQTTNIGGKEEFVVDYDYLVIAMGARANTFNTPVEDALKIRRSIIDCFERASLPSLNEEENQRILHFVVVGGGPTGVEFAAELYFLHEDLIKLYPDLQKYIKVTLLEASDHILNMFDKRITVFAEEKFKRDGIEVKTGSIVVKVTEKAISLKERATGVTKTLPFGMVVWYKHLGQFAPLGGDQAAAQLPGDWVSMGHSTQWLWYSVYAR